MTTHPMILANIKITKSLVSCQTIEQLYFCNKWMWGYIKREAVPFPIWKSWMDIVHEKLEEFHIATVQDLQSFNY
jgi:hypothetical protein